MDNIDHIKKELSACAQKNIGWRFMSYYQNVIFKENTQLCNDLLDMVMEHHVLKDLWDEQTQFIQEVLTAIAAKNQIKFKQSMMFVKDIKYHDSLLFRHAIDSHWDDAIEQLWDHSDVNACRSYALTHMSKKGHSKWVNRLIPLSDVSVDDSTPLRAALFKKAIKINDTYTYPIDQGEFDQVITALLPHSDLEACVTALRRSQSVYQRMGRMSEVECFSQAIHEAQGYLLHKSLSDALKDKGRTAPIKKM